MIRSMTGFGRGFAGRGKKRIDIEMRSVNSRFLEIKFRGIPLDPQIEQEIRKFVEKSIQRGNIQLRIELINNQEKQNIGFNKERFESLQNILKNIHINYGQRLNLSEVISTNDILKIDENLSLDKNTLLKAVEKATIQLNEMRLKEGILIFDDINKRTKNLEQILHDIEKITNQYADDKQLTLRNKILELLDKSEIDESRLIQEVAYYAERSDVTEEIVRSKSHLKQLKNYLNKDEPVGKRINFLLQEIVREVNTIGSKTPQTDVTIKVVDLKGELEKIREQVQNLL